MRTLLKTLLWTWLIYPGVTSAANDPWYQIEMIVFAHHDDNAAQEEHWPDDVNLTYPSNMKTLFELTRLPQQVDDSFSTTLQVDTPDLLAMLEAINQDKATSHNDPDVFETNTEQTTSAPENILVEDTPVVTDVPTDSSEDALPPLAFQLLDTGDENLAVALGHLRRIDRYRPLFHHIWQQPLQDRQHSPSILVTGGDAYGKHFELEGSVKISVERYLHIDTDLWLHSFAPNFGQPATVQVPTLPLPMQAEEVTQDTINPLLSSFLNDDTHVVSRTVTLRQSRRMRSGEIHYLDHPLMGVIVLVTPLERD
ncbi:MAG: hypothetical protein RL336_1929 [Pseudomonadota bacterium]|jgi:hypothetical protein